MLQLTVSSERANVNSMGWSLSWQRRWQARSTLGENISEVLVVDAAAPLVATEVLDDFHVTLPRSTFSGSGCTSLLPVLE